MYEFLSREFDVNQFDKICRLCLGNGELLNIFSDESKIIGKIKMCCKFELFKNDGLPEHVCTNCINTLDITNKFVKSCEDNNLILKNTLLKQNGVSVVKIKAEMGSDDDWKDFDHDYDSTSIKSDDSLVLSELKKTATKKKKKHKSNGKKSHKNYNKITTSQPLPIDEIKLEDDKQLVIKGGLCQFCGKYFDKTTVLNSHVRTHGPSEFTCTICTKSFRDSRKLKDHEKTHLNIRDIPCEVCGKLFGTRSSARKHIIAVHEKGRTVFCKVCDKQLANHHSLRGHMKIHTGEREFSCDICDRKFTFKCSLSVHMRCHTGEKPYSCKFCDAKFAALKTIREHERLHTGENPYLCPVCSKGFKQKSNMKSHFRNNHKSFDINLCNNVPKPLD